MKTKLIKTEKYLLVLSDEKKIGDICYGVDGIGIWSGVVESLKHEEQPKKIIAHLPLNGAEYLDGVDVLPDLYNQKMVIL